MSDPPKTTTGGKAGPDADKSEVLIKAKLVRAIQLVLFVRDQTGAPIKNATVDLKVPSPKLTTFKDAPATTTPPVTTTDADGRFATALNADETVDDDFTYTVTAKGFKVFSGKVTTGSIAPGGEFGSVVRANGCYVESVLLDAVPYTLSRRYLWQNKILRGAIFPTRNVLLRRFIALYEWLTLIDNLIAKYGDDLSGTTVDALESEMGLDDAAYHTLADDALAIQKRSLAVDPALSGDARDWERRDALLFFPTYTQAKVGAPPTRPAEVETPVEPIEPPPLPDDADDDAKKDDKTTREQYKRERAAYDRQVKALPAAQKSYAKALEAYEKKQAAYDASLADFATAVRTKIRNEHHAIARAHLYLYWRNLGAKKHNDLVDAVLEHCNDPALVQPWVKYMVLHFSGMVYKSAHGSCYRPESLLHYLRSDEVVSELHLGPTDTALSDAALIERVLDVKRILLDNPGKTTTMGVNLNTELDKAGVNKEGWTTISKESRKALLSLVEEAYLALVSFERVVAMAPTKTTLGEDYWTALQNVLALLVSRSPGSDGALSRDARYVFPDALWTYIQEHTHFLRESTLPRPTLSKDWSLIVPASASTPMKVGFSAWISADLGGLRKFARAAVTKHPTAVHWVNENVTGWRQYHEDTVDPSVVRAVCNEIEEHALHARGGKPQGGLMANAYQYRASVKQSLDASAFAQGGSIFYHSWRTDENSSAYIRPGTMPLLDVETGFWTGSTDPGACGEADGPVSALGGDYAGDTVHTHYRYVIENIPPKRLVRHGRSRQQHKDGAVVSEGAESTEVLQWTHEAPIVDMLAASHAYGGRQMVTFQTAQPTGINLGGIPKAPDVYGVTFPDLPSPTGDPRCETFFLKLTDLCEDD